MGARVVIPETVAGFAAGAAGAESGRAAVESSARDSFRAIANRATAIAKERVGERELTILQT
jgi:hypothetical protein